MQDVFVTSFGYGPIFECSGLLCLTIATFLTACHFKSYLLYLATLGFLVCAFSAIASTAMPIQFKGNIWPPHWVSWLAMVGSPTAILVGGVAFLAFAVVNRRVRT